VIGLPVGAWLCFWRGQGVTGLWIGLSLGLALVAVVLLIRWLWALGLPELHHAKVVAVDGEEPKA
jgi:Na+-driven multidrug efflux pump